MSNPIQFTDDQKSEIRRLISQETPNLKEAAKEATEAALKANQAKILDSIKDQIKKSVDENQTVIIATDDKEKKGSRFWGMLLEYGPAIIAGLFGIATAFIAFSIWQNQASIQQSIEHSNKALSTRLALSEELYKKKLSLYETASNDINGLIKALLRAEVNDQDRQAKLQISKSLIGINDLYQTKKLYLPDDVEQKLGEFWRIASDWQGLKSEEQQQGQDTSRKGSTREEIEGKATALIKLMRNDLYRGPISALQEGTQSGNQNNNSNNKDANANN
jgi:hypothetical protein